jgi:hypothetical protein
MNNDLLTGKLVRLAALNAEADAAVVARWDVDSIYAQLDSDPHVPSRTKIGKRLRKSRRKPERHRVFLRTLANDR